MVGNRGIYKDGWLARTIHRPAWLPKPPLPLAEDIWDLYNTTEDFSLSKNLATENPEKLKELQRLFMSDAEKYHVLPIDDRLLKRTNAELVGWPTVMGKRTSVTYSKGMKGKGVDLFINLRNKSYTITAEVEMDNLNTGFIKGHLNRWLFLCLYAIL